MVGNIEIMRYLNQKNPKLKEQRGDYGNFALSLAVSKPDLKTVKFLIEEVQVNIHMTGTAYENKGQNCFLVAAYRGEIEIMRYLNSKNSELKKKRDSSRNTALTLASTNADLETVKFLVEEMKMNVRAVGEFGRNCFLTAASVGRIEIMRYLNSIDDSLKYHRDNYNETAWSLAKSKVSWDKEEIVEFFSKELNVTSSGYWKNYISSPRRSYYNYQFF